MAGSISPLKRRISWFSLIIFYLVLLCLTWLLHWGKFTSNVDRLIHDGWVRISQRAPPDDVVIIGIDPDSLELIGRWPWSRAIQATMFNRLAKSDIRAAALDLLYVEPDADPSNDKLLADAVSRLPILVLPVLTEGRGLHTEYAEKLPIPRVSQQAEDLGHIFTPLDSDGIVRRVNLKSGFVSAHWSAMGLAMHEALVASSESGTEGALESLPGRRLEPPLNPNLWIEDHQVLIPFYGPGGTFTTVSAIDLITGKVPPDVLKDKIVFVGMTATGLGDVLPTAVSATDKPMPGVEIHANVFSAIRDQALVVELDNRWNFPVAALLLAIMLVSYSRMPPLWGLLSMGVLAIAPVVLSYVLYRVFHVWYAPLVSSIPVLISYFFWSWHRLEFIADFLRRETSKLVSDLVPVEDPDNSRLVNFFENSVRHLPLEGWRFSAMGQSYFGGEPIGEAKNDPSAERWMQTGDIYGKRYNTRGKLQISFKSGDKLFANEFMDYIDSLSRVKERQRLTKVSGTLERLQNHTYGLSQQLDRFRQVKVLSDSIFAGSPAGLIVWSASGEVVQINTLASGMLPNLDIESLSLHDFIEAIGREPEGRDREQVDALIRQRVSWQINRVELDTELVMNFSAFGETLADRLICASIIDVSDIRRSERSRSELIDFLSHDLRSPLISSLYLLKGEDGGVGRVENRTDRIESNINLSLSMIDDLLAIARADNLSSDAFLPMLFDSIVDNAIDLLSPEARSRNIKLDIITHDDDLWLECDAPLLERALVNIIGNSLKYSPENTVVTVETSKKDDFLIFRVTDQGVGIAPEMMDSLFQRFKRDKVISQKYKGTGLGLALVARVVSEHGGQVHALSPGKGTTIEVILPLSDS